MDETSDLQASYDRVATRYAEDFFDELSRKPFDRRLLDQFAEQVRGQGPVWDVGCGPGHVARYLHGRGLPVSGLDLSAGMIACARRLNPDISFAQGTMLALPMLDGSAAGIACFYAIIHLERAEAVAALREFWRVLRPGGALMLAFHGGQGAVQRDEWFGERVNVGATFFEGEEMARYAREAGFDPVAWQERPPYDFEYQSRRLYLSATRPLA